MPVLSDERQLIFFCAVPGSGWAKLSLLLGCCSKLNLNKSDRRPEWEEVGKMGDTKHVFHKGCFWDPMREYGNGFNDIESNYTKEEFIQECLRPFEEHDDKNYLIRSHFFAETKNLNWLVENFPKNRIIFVLREPGPCLEGWTTGMTFTKHYPNYKAWMKYTFIDDHPENYQRLWELINRHDAMIRNWILDRDCYIIQANKAFLNKLGYIWDEEGIEEYQKMLHTHQFHRVETPRYDAPFVFYNCNDFFEVSS